MFEVENECNPPTDCTLEYPILLFTYVGAVDKYLLEPKSTYPTGV